MAAGPDMIDLISKLFTPKGALLMGVTLTIFTALYTAIIKFFFGKRLKRYELDLQSLKNKDLEELRSENAVSLKRLEAQLTTQNQVLIQDLQAESARDLKTLEATLTNRNQAELQRLQAALGEKGAENKARRDYEYEARKRLYHECEPLIFQFVELCENALHRILGLARTARQGNLPKWLLEDEYYIASTMYYLLAPVVVYKLIYRRLTIVDLTLDTNIAVHYKLAKEIAGTFKADFRLAWGLKIFPLAYEPKDPNWRELRKNEPAKYWIQGLPWGRLDNAAESLIICENEPELRQRIMSFGEFESALRESSSTTSRTFAVVRDMISGFHPAQRPVLWRILVSQAHMYEAIAGHQPNNAPNRPLTVKAIQPKDRPRFYWLRNPSDPEKQDLEQPFAVAEAYLADSLGPLFQS